MKKAIFTLTLVLIIILPIDSQVFWQDDFGGTTPEIGGVLPAFQSWKDFLRQLRLHSTAFM